MCMAWHILFFYNGTYDRPNASKYFEHKHVCKYYWHKILPRVIRSLLLDTLRFSSSLNSHVSFTVSKCLKCYIFCYLLFYFLFGTFLLFLFFFFLILITFYGFFPWYEFHTVNYPFKSLHK